MTMVPSMVQRPSNASTVFFTSGEGACAWAVATDIKITVRMVRTGARLVIGSSCEHSPPPPPGGSMGRRSHSRGEGLLVAQEALFHRVEHGAGAAGGADLAVDVLQVVPDGMRADEQELGDLLDRELLGGQPQHLDLAFRELWLRLRSLSSAAAGAAHLRE